MTRGKITAPGRRLKAQREARGFTQVDLARLAGCSVRHIRLLERGYIPGRSRVLPDLLRVLHTPHNERSAGHHTDASQKDGDGAPPEQR